jgi:exosome complex component RRP42
VISVGRNIIFDPAKEELAVAEVAMAISVSESREKKSAPGGMEVDGRSLGLLSIRMVDPPSRLTAPGIHNVDNPATAVPGTVVKKPQQSGETAGVWKAPVGGAKFGMVQQMIEKVLEKGGAADEVLDGLDGVNLA